MKTVYTARIGYKDPDVLDITRKSGTLGSAFAPSWALLTAFLERRKTYSLNDADWDQYVTAYTQEMRHSYKAHPDAWAGLLRGERVVLVCYCTNSDRCHRKLLAGLLSAYFGFSYGGELQKKERPAHHCHARNCDTPCPPERLMCPKHWRMVPKKIQAAVWAHYRQGQCDDMSPSNEWYAAANAAIREVHRKETERLGARK